MALQKQVFILSIQKQFRQKNSLTNPLLKYQLQIPQQILFHPFNLVEIIDLLDHRHVFNYQNGVS